MPPSPWRGPSPASHKAYYRRLAVSSLPSPGGIRPVPPMSSPAGSNFGFVCQTGPPSRSLHPGPPRASTSGSLASNNPPLPPTGGITEVPPISSPGGSILGLARQTGPPSRSLHPGPPGPKPRRTSYPIGLHHHWLVVPSPSHQYRACGVQYSLLRAKPALPHVHRTLAPPALQTSCGHSLPTPTTGSWWFYVGFVAVGPVLLNFLIFAHFAYMPAPCLLL
jgi:hypothetical protein